MRTAIFFKSWREDIKWLKYSLQFLAKNWTDKTTEVVVVLDKDCEGQIDPTRYNLPRLKISYLQPWPDGYSHAMFTKASADQYTIADAILLMDSDAMLLEPARAQSFMEYGRPLLAYISYAAHMETYPFSPWFDVVKRVMQLEPSLHYMSRMPVLYWRETFKGLRDFIVSRHGGKPIEKILYSDVPFKPENFANGKHLITFLDYDCLGQYASFYQRDRYIFRHEEIMPPNPVRQFHSWSQWGDATIETLEQELAK